MTQLEFTNGSGADNVSPPAQTASGYFGDIDALNRRLAPRDALGVLRLAHKELFPGELAIVSSFGADSGVMLYLVAQIDSALPVLFLDTGQHFGQTIAYVKTLKAHFGLKNVRIVSPDEDDLLRFDPAGDLWRGDPDSCCHIRKTAPLEQALGTYGGWVTGRKRHQTPDRQKIEHFERDDTGKIKINPLAFWSAQDISDHKARHPFPQHPLLEAGYSSIGCAPCTSRIGAGEDARAGRWRGSGKIECGIHVNLKRKVAAVAKPEKTLFKEGGFVVDPWQDWNGESKPENARYVHVPLKEFLARRNEFLRGTQPLGLKLSGGDEIQAISGDLGRFSSISITFSAFTDGRGYSLARQLVERFGYGEELRAVGDVLTDQIAFMRRCGFNAFGVTNRATRKALENGAGKDISVFMQPIGKDEAPLGRRPFLRAAHTAS